MKQVLRMVRDNNVPTAKVREYIIVNYGVDEEQANDLLAELRKMCDVIDDDKKRANRNIVFGLLWCIGCLVVTIITFSATMNGVGFILFCVSIMIIGLSQLIRGIVTRIILRNF